MSDTAESLRRKISSASELQSVVRTMKALAASSITQYQKSVLALADYYRAVELGLGACLRASEPAASIPRSPRREAASAIVFAPSSSSTAFFGLSHVAAMRNWPLKPSPISHSLSSASFDHGMPTQGVNSSIGAPRRSSSAAVFSIWGPLRRMATEMRRPAACAHSTALSSWKGDSTQANTL